MTLDFQTPVVPEYAQARTKSPDSLPLAQPAESEQTPVLPQHSFLESAQSTAVAIIWEIFIRSKSLKVTFQSFEFHKSPLMNGSVYRVADFNKIDKHHKDSFLFLSLRERKKIYLIKVVFVITDSLISYHRSITL